MLTHKDKPHFQLGYAVALLAIESRKHGDKGKDMEYWRKQLNDAWEQELQSDKERDK
jgi:hypothetical protein